MALKDYLQVNNLTLIIVGNFNPLIIQPYWLAYKKLIREHEAIKASETIEVIHEEVVRFKLDWASIEVTRERFVISTTSEQYFQIVFDLITSIIGILKETPIRAFGINHLLHYALNNEKYYYDFGNKLVPLSNWSGFMNDPKMLHLDMIENQRKDKLPGHFRVKVLPSDLVPSSDNGIMIQVNNHFDIKTEKPDSSVVFLQTISKSWQESFTRTYEIAEKLWKIVTD